MSRPLAFNLPLCVLLILNFGFTGAAFALVLSELWQAMLLWITASPEERALVAPSLFVAAAGAVALVATGGAIASGGQLVIAAAAATATVLIVVCRWNEDPRAGGW